MSTYTIEVKNIMDSINSIKSELSDEHSQSYTTGVPMRLPTRIMEQMTRMTRMTRTNVSKSLMGKYTRTPERSKKIELFHKMVDEFTKRLQRYGAGGPELNLVNAAFRFFRHKYTNDDGLGGGWLLHEAFSLKKIMEQTDLDRKEKYALLTALFQSGKTFTVIDLSIIYLACRMTPIIVVPKSVDVRQINKRLESEMKKFVGSMKTLGFSDDVLSIYDEILYHSASNKLDDLEKFEMSISRERNRLILCLKHEKHINRLVDLDPNSNIVLFIDEAHIAGGYKKIHDDCDQLHDEGVKYDRAIAQLKAEAAKVILISATAASVMTSEHQLWSDCVYQKCPGPWYRGPAQIEYVLIGIKNADEEVLKTFTALSAQQPPQRTVYRDGGRVDFHPINILFHAIRSLDRQKSILQSFHNDNHMVEQAIIDSDWLVMTYQAEGLRVWHKSFMGQTIEIGGVKSTDYGSGEHLLSGIQPSQMYDWCGQNGGVKRFPRIATIAYDMAEEGVSFSTNNSPHWHLTHLLLFGNPSSARAAQIANRLCGNHGDNLPLTLYASNSNKHKTLKEFTAHDRWVKELCSLRQTGNYRVSEYITNKEHMEGHLPKKFITLKNSSGLLKTCDNPNLKAEKKAMRKSHASEICVVFDKEKFEDDFKKMVKEKKDLRYMMDKDVKNNGLVRVIYDKLTFGEKKLYREIVKIIKDTYFDRANQGIPRQDIIDKLQGAQRTTKSALTRIYQNSTKCVPATTSCTGLTIYQNGRGNSVTLYYNE